MKVDAAVETAIHKLQDIIGGTTDIGNRGMQALICTGDLLEASKVLVNLHTTVHDDDYVDVDVDVDDSSSKKKKEKEKKNILILSGFPCCVDANPPTESDGPAGALTIARACIALQHRSGHTFNVIIVTDECNEKVFAACINDLVLPVINSSTSSSTAGTATTTTTTAVPPQLQSFPANMSDKDYERMGNLAQNCALYIACERAGPGKDGVCYTMRGIDMNARGFIAPLERFVLEQKREEVQYQRHHQDMRPLFIAIGDGGNELGMGKVMDKIINNTNIPNGDKIACVVSADYLIAASISNWGGYALAAGAAICRAAQEEASLLLSPSQSASSSSIIQDWVSKCLPTDDDEIALMNRGVAAGMRDGVTGKLEATVDGFPLETSLQCLRDVRVAALTAFE